MSHAMGAMSVIYRTQFSTAAKWFILLASNDVGRFDALGGVAGGDAELRLLHDARVVVTAVGGHDQDRVVLAKVIERGIGHVQVVVASPADGGEERVVVRGHRSLFA